MNKPIDNVPFVESKPMTIEQLIELAVSKGADQKSIEIFLKTLNEQDCSIVDSWDTYLTD